jgi:hypothetical protein
VADVELEILRVDVAPVREVVGEDGGNILIHGRLDGAGEPRIATVSADRQRGALFDHPAAGFTAADAHHHALLEEVLVDGETLTKLGAALHRGVGEDLVERRATRPESPRHAVLDEVGGEHRIVIPVEDQPRDGRRPLGDTVEQPPCAEPRRTVPVHEVSVRDVARKRRTIDQEHPGALPGEQHRQWRPGAACANDDDVVHDLPPWLDRLATGATSRP